MPCGPGKRRGTGGGKAPIASPSHLGSALGGWEETTWIDSSFYFFFPFFFSGGRRGLLLKRFSSYLLSVSQKNIRAPI